MFRSRLKSISGTSLIVEDIDRSYSLTFSYVPSESPCCCVFSFHFDDSRCGFGLLMYGFGSKKGLLEDFASSSLTEYSVVVINGYLPSVNLKQVLFGHFGCRISCCKENGFTSHLWFANSGSFSNS